MSTRLIRNVSSLSTQLSSQAAPHSALSTGGAARSAGGLVKGRSTNPPPQPETPNRHKCCLDWRLQTIRKDHEVPSVRVVDEGRRWHEQSFAVPLGAQRIGRGASPLAIQD